jgi:uncharacterized protein
VTAPRATVLVVDRLRALLLWPLVAFVRAYQLVVRPLLPPLCRFHPSCSDYALEALHVHGPAKGAWLATKRVCRCGPWTPGGFDPVPPVSRRRLPTTPAG